MFIADGHQDIASSVLESGRDFSVAEEKYSLSLPGLGEAGVGLVLATVFAAGEGTENFDGVPAALQLEYYDSLLLRNPGRLGRLSRSSDPCAGPEKGFTRIGILLEGADPLSGPSDLAEWRRRGLTALSLTWNGPNRFAGGVGSEQGLTPEGRDLLDEMSRLSIVLDVSHLNDRSFADVLQAWSGPVCASHSNARELAPSRRNLTDGQIAALADRGGVIGLNFYQGFLTKKAENGPRATVEDVVRHGRHIAAIGGASCLALGTDFDGGFGPAMSPEGCERLEELPALAAAFSSAGFTDGEVEGIMGLNWAGFLGPHLP